MRRDISRTSPLDVRSLSRLFTNKLVTDGFRLSHKKKEHRVVFFFCYKRVDGARFHVNHVKTDPPPSAIEPFAVGASHHSLGVARDAGSRATRIDSNAQHAWSRARIFARYLGDKTFTFFLLIHHHYLSTD